MLRAAPSGAAPREAAILAELEARRSAASSYRGYVDYLHPKRVHPPFHLEYFDILDRLEKRTLRHPLSGNLVYNVLINMPPRHSKSTYGTVMLPPYLLGRKPTRKVMVASYNTDMATDFGKESRAIVMAPDYGRLFPKFALSRDTRAGNVWKTTERGAYYGVGLDGTTSGRPSNALLIDDPLKNRTEAESAAVRRNVWDFITSALWMRMEPEEDGTPPIQTMVLTRWHPDDPAGRLKDLPEWKNHEWLHVNFPGLEDLGVGTDGQRVYKALWPERFPVDYLLRQKSRSERDFQALYQQEPIVEGGNLFKDAWWQRYEPDPTSSAGLPSLDQYATILIAIDTAFKQGTRNDYSAIAVGGLTARGDIHILHVERGKWDFPTLKSRLIQLNAIWRPRGLRAIIVEDMASGQSLVQEMRRESGLSVIPRRWPGDKMAHASSVMPLIEGGRVFLPPKAPWLEEFLTEVRAFPTGTFDDQVDALSFLLNELSRTAISPEMMEMAFNSHRPLDPNSLKGLYGDSLAKQLASQFDQISEARRISRWGE